MITKSNYLGIVVDDLAASTAFYRDTLGMSVDEQQSVPGQHTAFHLEGDTTLALQAGSQVPDSQKFEPTVQVEDVDATYAAWKARGVDLLDEPNDQFFGRTFLFRTPDGHVLRVYQA